MQKNKVNINNINNIKKYKIKKGENISKSPYILEIPKFKINESLLESGEGLKFKSSLSPISNSELEYNPDLYNKDPHIKVSHNCYTYAMGKIVPGLDSKAQPGYASGFNHVSSDNFTCKSFRQRLKKDAPGSYLEKFDNSCIPGFYKVFLALDPQNDYHWWRQNLDTKWSHKPGSSDVVNLDASGKEITNPLTSDRDFKHRNYYKPCFFACIYSDLSRSLDTIYSNNF